MKSLIKIIILTFLGFVAQTAFFQYIDILGIVPNIVLVIAIAYSLTTTSEYSPLVFSGVCGFIADFLTTGFIGIYTLLFVYTSAICRGMQKRLFKYSLAVSVISTVILSIAFELVYYIIFFAFSGGSDFFYVLLRIILPTSVYNGIIAALLYPVFGKWIIREEQ